MKSLYERGPSNVPETLVQPTKSFKKHVIIATISLFFFVVIYLLLMCWFGKLSYNLFEAVAAGTDKELMKIVTGVCLAFLSIFMLKSLFIFKKKGEDIGKEITEKDEPVLFDYLYQLADEAGAPRPHKVFLTSRVNASVFYDLSIVNLLLPSKKNLEIGLGLINVLSIGELKAVLAHEFGHFAQRSMLLGRYVYTAQQIAQQIINKRDALDKIISGLSSIDIRIAWIGWVLSILVWAIRSLIHTLFSAVAVAERALSREMEFQADLVAVSLTGSDALIHALKKLGVADDAYHVALNSINKRLADKQAIPDLFSLQSNHIAKMSWLLNEPDYGKSPSREGADGNTRVFKSQVVNPPEMWMTHPADKDREENAKRTYIYADINNGSSWDLFTDPQKVRLSVTKELIATANVKDLKEISEEEGIQLMNKEEYDWTFLDPKYRGAYLSRHTMLNFKTADEIYEKIPQEELKSLYASLYPRVLSDRIDEYNTLREEITILRRSQFEVITAEKRVIVHRGNQIKRKDIPNIIKKLEDDLLRLRTELIDHDWKARATNYEAAKQLDTKVADYLKTVGALVHYAEHSIENLNDVMTKFHNTLQVILADGRVSSSEMTQLMTICNEVHKVLSTLYAHRNVIELDAALEEKVGKTYVDLFEEFTLGLPREENINDWVNVVEGWAVNASNNLSLLRNAALERLLDVEEKVKQAYLQAKPLTVTVGEISLAAHYFLLMPGSERELQQKLGLWDRFHQGDGIFPTIAKFAVSAAIIIFALYMGNFSYQIDFYIYNGLSKSVDVKLNGKLWQLSPHSYRKTEINYGEEYELLTTTPEGDTIEQFSETTIDRNVHVYNIASAGSALEYTVSYGIDYNVPNRFLGAPRWFSTKVDYVLIEPPSNVRTSSGRGAKREVLDIASSVNPYIMMQYVEDEKELERMVLNHAKWDEEKSPQLLNWMGLAADIDSTFQFVKFRQVRNPYEVSSWRTLQDQSSPEKKTEVCEKVQQLKSENSLLSNLHYLSIRCMEDGVEQDEAFLKGNKEWPENGWLAMASAYIYASREQWQKSYEQYETCFRTEPQLMNYFAMDFERIRKKIDTGVAANELLAKSEQVDYYRDLERGILTEGDENNSAFLLAQGKLDSALNYANNFQERLPYFKWALACSEGTNQNVVNEVLSYEGETGISNSTIWMAMALRAKNNLKIDYLLDQLEKYTTQRGFKKEKTRQFLNQVKQQQIELAQKTLSEVNDFREKTYHQLMGVIILGTKVPSDWLDNVHRILYITEKPYLSY